MTATHSIHVVGSVRRSQGFSAGLPAVQTVIRLDRPSRCMRGYHVGRIWGIPIRIHPSLLVVLPVFAWLLGKREPF